MTRPRLLDLFCGAGGATKGLQRAGFYVVGVDINSQPRYCGDEFYQADAMTFPLEGYDAYWASPPCQWASEAVPKKYRKNTPNLIAAIRKRLTATGRPYIIENVDGAKRWLRNPIRLHGSMFGLRVHRSRWFEMHPQHLIVLLPSPYPSRDPVVPTGQSRRRISGKRVRGNSVAEVRQAMGMPWATGNEISNAIPPAYSEYIGQHLMKVLR